MFRVEKRDWTGARNVFARKDHSKESRIRERSCGGREWLMVMGFWSAESCDVASARGRTAQLSKPKLPCRLHANQTHRCVAAESLAGPPMDFSWLPAASQPGPGKSAAQGFVNFLSQDQAAPLRHAICRTAALKNILSTAAHPEATRAFLSAHRQHCDNGGRCCQISHNGG